MTTEMTNCDNFNNRLYKERRKFGSNIENCVFGRRFMSGK